MKKRTAVKKTAKNSGSKNTSKTKGKPTASSVKKAKDKPVAMPKNIKSIWDNGGKSIDK